MSLISNLFSGVRREAVDTHGATALVCANDRVALRCLAYLKRHRRDGDISVAGFDNTAAAVTHRLTSYSFNTEATITAMVKRVLSPPARGLAASGCAITAIEGRIMERASTMHKVAGIGEGGGGS